jgi:hypothetical protein
MKNIPAGRLEVVETATEMSSFATILSLREEEERRRIPPKGTTLPQWIFLFHFFFERFFFTFFL